MSSKTISLSDDRFNGWLESPVIQAKLDDALQGADDGELFLESSKSEMFQWSDGKLKTAALNMDCGFGLRTVCNELVGFAHSNELSEEALGRAMQAVRMAKLGASGAWDVSPVRTNQQFYRPENPFEQIPLETKIATLQQIDAYAREKNPHVRQVTASLASSYSVIDIMRPGGERYHDIRPLVRLTVQVMMEEAGRMETGSSAAGGRYELAALLGEESWRHHVDEAVRIAGVNLKSRPAPAGKQTVVLEAGWPGVMIHEAVGHGLEGDAVRKNQSVYAGCLGRQVAAKGVTIVDNGAIGQKRGSLSIDDEGTPTQESVLIEDGVLKGFMHDRLSARLMGQAPTGNGRKQSYDHPTLPRMTNTYMLSGDREPEEILASVKDGVYAVSLGGGQVNPVSGDFVFECAEAYRVRNGKMEEPIKGATLIGNGPEAMKNVTMIGNNSKLDTGIGTCGKQGQTVPVGVGQPTLRMEDMTVGGTGGAG